MLGHWVGTVTTDAGAPGVGEVRLARQVHGVSVVTVGSSSPRSSRPHPDRSVPVVSAGLGDALVASDPGVGLAVLTADCASVALGSGEGVFAAVHAGWRGLQGGVLQAAVAVMRELGATEVVGALGPCIHAECYEFSADDLDAVAVALGDAVRGRTAGGAPALELPTSVSGALRLARATERDGVDACTGCGGDYFSHRARRERERQALLVWSRSSPDGPPLSVTPAP